MKQILEIETSRLVLRQWTDKDFPVFAEINADSNVMQYYPNILNAEESNAMASKLQFLIAERGWGFWAVERKGDHSFIGFVGLHEPLYSLPVQKCVEIGWRLASSCWGKGYATEAAQASLVIAFENLKLTEIYSFTPVSNVRSRAVMERLGMRDTKNNFEHPIIPKGHHLREHVLYMLDRETWLANCY